MPRPEPLRISPTATIQGRIQNLRAQLWSLLSDLEVLRPEDRAALTEDLALLDAGAHTAVTLARGVAA